MQLHPQSQNPPGSQQEKVENDLVPHAVEGPKRGKPIRWRRNPKHTEGPNGATGPREAEPNQKPGAERNVNVPRQAPNCQYWDYFL